MICEAILLRQNERSLLGRATMHVLQHKMLAILVAACLFACLAETDATGQSGLSAQQSSDAGTKNQRVTPEAQIGPVSSQPALCIGNGDLLEVNVYSIYGAPDLSQKLRVSDTGDVSLPLVGRIHVAGLTAQEAQTSIERRFQDGEFVKHPHVAVFIAEYATQGVSVLGEVAKPGVYPITAPRTLYDLISLAGGLTANAGKLVTITHRNDPEEVKVLFSNSTDPAKQNVSIFPGDTIIVAKAGIVYVVGDVGKPGGFAVDNRGTLTVLQAIALAEGTKPNAALNAAKLIRRTAAGELSEVSIPLKKIMSAKAPDLPLRVDDIVFVPSSTAKGAAKRSLEAIVQVATGLAIYRPW
jgi:polysaccharide export outer membrane protein